MYFPVIERIRSRPEKVRISFTRERIVFYVLVLVVVVVSGKRIPRDADKCGAVHHRLEYCQIVERYVSQKYAEFISRSAVYKRTYHLLSEIPGIGAVATLRIAEHEYAELLRLLRRIKREIDLAWRFPVGAIPLYFMSAEEPAGR